MADHDRDSWRDAWLDPGLGDSWQEVATVEVAAPVLAVVGDTSGTWAGGSGGIAARPAAADNPATSGWPTVASPVGTVAALARLDGRLLTGGGGGVAYSTDGGRRWTRGQGEAERFPVADLTGGERTVLAATLGGGVLRSEDAGDSWRPASFGLASLEVTALRWGPADCVLAGTAGGIHRSTNAGRSWRLATGTGAWPVAALSWAPDGEAVAVGEDGILMRSTDRGRTWASSGSLPSGAVPAALCRTADHEILVGTLNLGILRSSAGWQSSHPAATFGFASPPGRLLAATEVGVLTSRDAGRTWQPDGTPPVHDLARTTATTTGDLFVWGHHAGLFRCASAPGLARCAVTPELVRPGPLTAVAADHAGGLLGSGPDGLARSVDAGRTWTELVPGADGQVRHLTVGADGTGWAVTTAGDAILRCDLDRGEWAMSPVPWAAAEVVALLGLPGTVLAAVHEPHRQLVSLWRSERPGAGWRRAIEVPAAAAAVALCADPPAALIGRACLVRDAAGGWRRATAPGGTVRRLTGGGDRLLALTDHGIALSTDRGRHWRALAGAVPGAGAVRDVALAGDAAYALLPAGRLWRRPLSP